MLARENAAMPRIWMARWSTLNALLGNARRGAMATSVVLLVRATVPNLWTIVRKPAATGEMITSAMNQLSTALPHTTLQRTRLRSSRVPWLLLLRPLLLLALRPRQLPARFSPKPLLPPLLLKLLDPRLSLPSWEAVLSLLELMKLVLPLLEPKPKLPTLKFRIPPKLLVPKPLPAVPSLFLLKLPMVLRRFYTALRASSWLLLLVSSCFKAKVSHAGSSGNIKQILKSLFFLIPFLFITSTKKATMVEICYRNPVYFFIFL